MKYKLGSEITSGGEGIIYEIQGNKNLVAKIFKRPQENQHLRDLIPYLSKLPKDFITPLDIIEDGVIKGFVMDKVPSSYKPISFTKYDKSGVSVDAKIELFKIIRKSIEFAHSVDIQLGDINGENILYNKDVRFLDTTSYQTPLRKLDHYYLQPEITDYLNNHNGISNETDAFAFAALSYEILTGCHPYRGGYPISGSAVDKLKHRVVNKISILGTHQGLIIPPIHKAIGDAYLKDQYFNIFEKGDRFLVNFDKKVTLIKTVIANDGAEVIAKLVYSGVIDKFQFNNNVIIVNDNSYSIEGKGWYRMDKKNTQMDYYCGDYYRVDTYGKIFRGATEVKSVNLYRMRLHWQNGCLLALDDNDNMYRIDLRDGSFAHTKTISDSFGIGFGVKQYLGGKSFLQVVKGGKFNTIGIKYNVVDFHQISEDYLCIKYKESNVVKFGYIEAKDNAVVIRETDELKISTYKDGYVFEPQDGKIAILRVQDFQEIGTFKTPQSNSMSQLYMSIGGIVLKNQDEIYLINKN